MAARTAPKARGMDELIVTVVDGDDLERLADEMQRIGEARDVAFFTRDAKNIRTARMIVLIGVRNKTRGVPVCGNCGFANCAENAKASGVCALCVVDLGIAVGSAVSVAADRRVDTRVMFSAGKAAIALGFLEGAHTAYGLPLSVSGKNPFFDRQ
ncbi:MAG: ferredoxin [Treponema sp. GWB1_62_6]|nr:MAG: ferredoxin [Treponema sp. GWB1_62_6]